MLRVDFYRRTTATAMMAIWAVLVACGKNDADRIVDKLEANIELQAGSEGLQSYYRYYYLASDSTLFKQCSPSLC